MPGASHTAEIKDPYRLLALAVLNETFRTIKCYLSKTGSKEEMLDGRRALKWIYNMDGNFKVYALASGMEPTRFHQLCMWKITQIKKEVGR